jgi:biotin synthase
MATAQRFSRDEINTIYTQPLLELVFQAAQVHRQHQDSRKIQCATLLSVKTGGCAEDCGYCSQSAHHKPGKVKSQLIGLDEVKSAAKEAREAGSDRLCIGAAWRTFRNDKDLQSVKDMIRAIKDEGLESCATMGMLTQEQANELKEAGLDYYNHNLDTSPEYYPKVITTRTYQDRLDTLAAVREADMKICSGGILGLGEEQSDRVGLLEQLANLEPQPESVPINVLVPIQDTPLAMVPSIDWVELVRAVATARILMPESWVRLSAGREKLTEEGQALCFMAGANSIFSGDRLLTTDNNKPNADKLLFEKLGLSKLEEKRPRKNSEPTPMQENKEPNHLEPAHARMG